MTTIYFVRHAKPDYSVHNDLLRPLTDEGFKHAQELVAFFEGIPVHRVMSSPFLRALDTVKPLAESRGLTVELVESFRERTVSSGEWIENFNDFARNQWLDFSYRLAGGECLKDVQKRNVDALMTMLKDYEDDTIVVGSHGTALSTIIHHFNSDFSYEDFKTIQGVMPWIVKFEFRKGQLYQMSEFKLQDVLVME